MKKFLFVLMVAFSFAVNAQVSQVSGNQSGTWSGEIHLTGDVLVSDDETLTINAGTTVIADGYYGITVLGTFHALGTEDDRIAFTVADTTGYSNYDDYLAGAWKGITFSKSNGIKLHYCDFSYGKTMLEGDGGAMRVYLVKNFEASNCTFHHNTTRRRGGAVYAENSTLNMHDCEIFDCSSVGFQGSYTWGVGFQFLKCDIDMHDMVFHDNDGGSAYGGGMSIDSCNMVLENAVFYNNNAVNAGGLGIQRCKDYTVKIANMLAYNNYVVHYGGGLAMATSDPELNNLTIVNNYCGGGGGAGMQTAFDASPTLNNCIFWDNHALSQDTTEYYYGSQIWLWGTDCRPVFNNGDIQYGLDYIYGQEYMEDDQYNDMIDDNPLFVNALNNDYRLSEGSPCINAGRPDINGCFIPYVDLGGGPRICGGRIDMGCYEFGYEDVNEAYADEKSVSIYPNPLNDNSLCVVNLAEKTDVVLRLISIDGRELYRKDCGTLEAGENHIPLDEMMRNIEKSSKVYLLAVDNRYIRIIY